MNTAELKALAEKATPGPWVAAGPSFGDPLPRYLTSVVVDREEDDDHADEICRAPGGCESICTSDMDFIGAANPAAILELIADHEDAQGEIRALRATEQNLRERVKALEEGLRDLYKGYVNLLQGGKDRIESLGGACDAVDRMEADSPYLRSARALLEQKP